MTPSCLEMTPARLAINLEHRKAAAHFADKSISVLDCGSGDVSGQKPAWTRPAREYVSVDFHESRGPSVVGDLRKLPFANAAFDVVLCSQVLEHVYETTQCMEELHRVTRQVCIIDTPFLYECHSAPKDYWRFTTDCMERLCNEAGFHEARARFLSDEAITWTEAFKESL